MYIQKKSNNNIFPRTGRLSSLILGFLLQFNPSTNKEGNKNKKTTSFEAIFPGSLSSAAAFELNDLGPSNIRSGFFHICATPRVPISHKYLRFWRRTTAVGTSPVPSGARERGLRNVRLSCETIFDMKSVGILREYLKKNIPVPRNRLISNVRERVVVGGNLTVEILLLRLRFFTGLVIESKIVA